MEGTGTDMLPPAPAWVREEKWTAEQQKQEMERRSILLMKVNSVPLRYRPRPTDVVVATFPKSGTTWVLHICHQLRMRGAEPDFADQEDVLSLLDLIPMGLSAGRVLGEDGVDRSIQPAEPHIFATHVRCDAVPRGGKIITCLREPKDVVLSLCFFVDSVLSLKGRVSFQIISSSQIRAVKGMLESFLYWWEHRHDPDVLLLFYDDMKEDHVSCVRRIASFIGIVDCSEEVISRVVHTTTHTEMSRHHSKFDSHNFIAKISEILGDVPPTEFVGRVRKDGGKSGEGKKLLPEELKQQIDKEWKDLVTTKLGFKDLNEMRMAWMKEQ